MVNTAPIALAVALPAATAGDPTGGAARSDDGQFRPALRSGHRAPERRPDRASGSSATRRRNSGVIERFGFEASTQAVHAASKTVGTTDWTAIEHLCRCLLAASPAICARIGHAVAVAEAVGFAAALALLDGIAETRIVGHQPQWVARARVLEGGGHLTGAAAAYDRAIDLTEDAASRRFLAERKARLAD